MPSARCNARRRRAIAKRTIWGAERPAPAHATLLGLMPTSFQLRRITRDAGPAEAFTLPAKGGAS